MNVYIRHRDSGLYFKSVDHWVSSTAEARCFESKIEALDFSKKMLLSQVEALSQGESKLLEKSRDSLGLMRFALPQTTPPAKRLQPE